MTPASPRADAAPVAGLLPAFCATSVTATLTKIRQHDRRLDAQFRSHGNWLASGQSRVGERIDGDGVIRLSTPLFPRLIQLPLFAEAVR